MPIGVPPINSALPVLNQAATWSKPWSNWFTQLFLAIVGWKHSFYATKTHDFGLIAAQSQATATLTVTGASVGDIVIVRPTTAVNGIIIDATVTAANTVTIRAANYSSGGIDPASQDYHVLVLQQ